MKNNERNLSMKKLAMAVGAVMLAGGMGALAQDGVAKTAPDDVATLVQAVSPTDVQALSAFFAPVAAKYGAAYAKFVGDFQLAKDKVAVVAGFLPTAADILKAAKAMPVAAEQQAKKDELMAGMERFMARLKESAAASFVGSAKTAWAQAKGGFFAPIAAKYDAKAQAFFKEFESAEVKSACVAKVVPTVEAILKDAKEAKVEAGAEAEKQAYVKAIKKSLGVMKAISK